ncbi:MULTISPECIES: TIGR02587 family membrane protein [unclassified Rhizobium]|uniref:TIGR02587 family membrane protein n=1 Tax=unclassified Rhizobium TaxID=2613769 RepID=UPI001FD94B13|nr:MULTISPECIES: TIGR02587 family membrane protein [unclassified Rhizobium]MBP2459524.1 putative integral membrane protein (TIGR02587 family) [Rhizobium sp. PvP014]MBP2531818.1 putative integral membrane protein (TIGR02587 family) [Rhizobium sp. PvP099]
MGGTASIENSKTQADGELRRFLVGLGRGAAGAMLFGIPMLMTMELWELGFYIEQSRLLILLLFNIPLLIVLAHLIGFERTSTFWQAVRDALTAFALGIVMSGAALVMLGVLKADMPMATIIGKIAIQAVPASIGAMLGRSQLGGEDNADDEDDETSQSSDAVPDSLSTNYVRELFLMAIGALFLNLNVAPTEEVVLISYKMMNWHGVLTILVSIAIMHCFVYAVSFRGGHRMPEDSSRWPIFFRYTLPGYMVAMLVSLYVLWIFGRLDGMAATPVLISVIVLSFPGAIGAAAARLIL